MTQQEVLYSAQEPPRSAVRDELLECLQTIALAHDHAVTPDALTAGLPLEEGRLTPGVFARAAARAGMTARIAKSRLVQLNPALFPAILLLEPGRACVLVGLDLKSRRARVIFPELGDAVSEVDLDGLAESYSGQA
ncbi:MAG: type I secretion system permease/ATPase, partial [Billgrantia desiderata]